MLLGQRLGVLRLLLGESGHRQAVIFDNLLTEVFFQIQLLLQITLLNEQGLYYLLERTDDLLGISQLIANQRLIFNQRIAPSAQRRAVKPQLLIPCCLTKLRSPIPHGAIQVHRRAAQTPASSR